jgi:hypothetical protein
VGERGEGEWEGEWRERMSGGKRGGEEEGKCTYSPTLLLLCPRSKGTAKPAPMAATYIPEAEKWAGPFGELS